MADRAHSTIRRALLAALSTVVPVGACAPLTLAAGPPSGQTLAAYAAWLHMERRRLLAELLPGMPSHERHMLALNHPAAWAFHMPEGDLSPAASTRAALVLDAVGVEWRR